jgi:hypothetical protein
MGRTATKDITKTATKIKKTIQKDDAGEQKKRRRAKAVRFTYEVRKGAKKNDLVLQSSSREVLAAVFEDASKRLLDMVKNINPSRATVKALDARCGSSYFVAASCHNADELIKKLGPIHDKIDAQLRADKEERKGK